MAFNRSKAFEISADGLLLEDGTWLTSGAGLPTHSANAGDRYERTDGSLFKNTSSPSPGTTWIQVTEATGMGGGSSMSINPANGGGGATAFMESTSSSYMVVGSTSFLGTTKVGIPTNMIVVIGPKGMQDEGKKHDVKIVDFKNGNVLAEKLNIVMSNDENDKVIIDLGTISNLPTDQVPIELQARESDTGGGKAHIYAFRDVL